MKRLYKDLVQRLNSHSGSDGHYCRPITVLNQQTNHRSADWQGNEDTRKYFTEFLDNYVRPYSEIVEAWCVDTCQMWLSGFGKAFDSRKGPSSDVYWLIPGDFDYDDPNGSILLDTLEELPNKVFVDDYELCLGEIEVPLNSSKQLIDTYGTYGLLYNWFPYEAQVIREKTDKPRTEFFAINHSYLRQVLDRRWYAYEQQIIILLSGIQGREELRRIGTMKLGQVTDLPPEGTRDTRDSLSGAMQQVERTERALKLFWRERNQRIDPSWPDKFRKLDAQSEQIRGAALVILEQILR